MSESLQQTAFWEQRSGDENALTWYFLPIADSLERIQFPTNFVSKKARQSRESNHVSERPAEPNECAIKAGNTTAHHPDNRRLHNI